MVRYVSTVSLFCSAFFLMLGVGLTVSLLPARMVILSGSFSDVGYLASFFALPFVLLQVPVGALADRYGYKAFLTCGYVLCCLAALVYCYSETPAGLYFGRFLQGVGEVPVWALAPALLSIEWPAGTGKAMGMYNASIHLGLTGGSLMGLLIVDGWDGNEAFMVLAATALFGGLLVVLFTKNRSGATYAKVERVNLKTAAALIISRDTRPVFTGIALYGCGYGMFLTVIPMSLLTSRPNDQFSVALFFVLFYIAVSLSQLMGGAVSDRAGRVQTMVSGMALAAVCLPMAFRFEGATLLIILALASFGLGVFWVSSMAALSESVPVSCRGTISGAFYLSWGGGFFIGPVLLGWVAHRGYFELGMLVFSTLLMGNVVVLVYSSVSDHSMG